jgi:transglutaminase-like putative cysteine protease
MTAYRVVHTTAYSYAAEVAASYGEAHLLPRARPGQTCRSARVDIDPAPLDRRERTDFFGNRTLYFAILEAHRRLTVRCASEVETSASTPPLLADQPWEDASARMHTGQDDETMRARQFVVDSPLVASSPGLRAYALQSFTAGRALVDALLDLNRRVHDEFEYLPGSTSVQSTVDEAVAQRRGVCQDFAHVVVGCLRSLGLAARYVSGYLDTDPPGGRGRLQGTDASHAWASVLVPGAGWLDVDPTNDQLVNEGYVTVGWGRDYGDVPPLKGVIYTEGGHDLDVTVAVERLAE